VNPLIAKYLTEDDRAAIRQARGRQLAEQLYALTLVASADTTAAREALEAELEALEALEGR
jgi:hypothetical protein